MRQRWFIGAVSLLVVVIAALAWQYTHPANPRDLKESLPITRYNLSNGLSVIVIENTRTQAVSHMMFVKAGGGDDPAGKSGLAHFAEHMMFKGTKSIPGAEYDRRIAALGADGNAFTTSDYTAYYVNTPVDALDTVMALEADRFMNLRVSDADAATELKVIREERKLRVESSPAAILSEQMDAMQFISHPYRIPVIGWDHEMATFAAQDVRDYIAQHYRASNMVLVVSGAVEPKEVRRLAMKHYGALKAEPALKRQWLSDPPARAQRQVIYRDERVVQRQWRRQYSTISVNTAPSDDVVALGLATQWLGGGRTGLLYQMLVDEQKLAIDVGAYYNDGQFGAGTLSLYATPAEGVTLTQLTQAMDEALLRISKMQPNEDEVQRAKTLLRADIVFAQDSLMGIASYVGLLTMIGKDEQFFYALPDIVSRVNAAQMQTILRSALQHEASVTGWLLPLKKAGL